MKEGIFDRKMKGGSRLGLNAKAALTVGAGEWHTAAAPRAGIRSLMLCDGPAGIRKEDFSSVSPDDFNKHDSFPATCLPCGAALGASWNPQLVAEAASAVAREAKALGVDVLLGPAINHKRTPLGGRNFEYISEDPLLTGTLAAAYIRGVQSEHVAACPKHYCANNTEYNRLTIDIDIDEDVLREIYLKGFEIAVKKGAPYCVMGAYNRLFGEYCCENERLLNGILRKEWGFDGLVVSDWRAVHDRVAALKAGCDLEMPFMTRKSAADVVKAVRGGTLDAGTLDKSVWRIKRLGVLTAGAGRKPDFDDNYAAAERLAEESAVLLKNDGLLPLSPGAKIALVGGRALRPKFQGGGSARMNARKVSTISDELRKYRDIRYAEGFTAGAPEEDKLLAAENAAKSADAVVVVLSSPPSDDAEDRDRAGMRLEAGAVELVRRMTETGKPVCLVLQSGAPVEIPYLDRVSAVLETFLSGSGGGEAAAKILVGEVNPSGKLAETYPVRYEDCPAAPYYGTDPDVMRYGEGLLTGYRYYTTKNVRPAYPFGWGLSYTTFTYSDLTAEPAADGVHIAVTVTNTGSRDGKETVQFYANKRPEVKRELIGFVKTEVPAGKSVRAETVVDYSEFAVYEGGERVYRKDAYEITASPHAFGEGPTCTFVPVVPPGDDGTDGVLIRHYSD